MTTHDSAIATSRLETGVTRRNLLFVVFLSLVTFSLYAFYWLYVTTRELKESTQRRDLDPLMDLLLAIVTFGMWGIYAAYRNARIAHEELRDLGIAHEDRSLLIAASGIASVGFPFCWLVGVALLQEDYNLLASAETAIPVSSGPMPVAY